MNNWSQQLKNNLLEWLCFNVDDCFTWHSLALTNRFCSLKCREYAPLKKREFSKKLYTNDGYEEETTYYLPGTGEAHGFQIAKYNKKTYITIREDWYQNGVHCGRWFTDIVNDKIEDIIQDLVYSEETKYSYDKLFVLRSTFIYLSFDEEKLPYFFHVPKKNIIGDFCDYCHKCHFFNISCSNDPIYDQNIVYSKNCLDTVYTFKLLTHQQYYKMLDRYTVAR